MNPLIMPLRTDGYKIDHRQQYNPSTKKIVCNGTPRKSRIPGIDTVVWFGNQFYMIDTLINGWNENFFYLPWEYIEREFKQQMLEYTLSQEAVDHIGIDHWKALWDLKYLPIEVRSLEEGAIVPIKVPTFTVTNTIDEFYWLPNFLETDWQAEVWGFTTSATIAFNYRKIFEKWATTTGVDLGFVPFQGHNFSYRGMLGYRAAGIVDLGHLTSFVGSDTIFGRKWAQDYYFANQTVDGIISCSVFATEHAVMCTSTGFYIKNDNLDWERYGEAEFKVFKRLITEVYPNGIVSIVCDTWDLWQVIIDYMVRLKDVILARDGKVVVRPDSGDPADILCGMKIHEIELDEMNDPNDEDDLDEYLRDVFFDFGDGYDHSLDSVFYAKRPDTGITYEITFTQGDFVESPDIYMINVYKKEVELKPSHKGVVELLYEIFPGTNTDKGFKQLDPKVGTIYGDSINLARAEDICQRLADKGFASNSWVAGIGSYTYQYVTRDTFGWAFKATYAEVVLDNGERVGVEIFKDPITDDGMKKSAKGLVVVYKDANGKLYLKDQATWEEVESEANQLKVVFKDGKLVKGTTLKEVRERLIAA